MSLHTQPRQNCEREERARHHQGYFALDISQRGGAQGGRAGSRPFPIRIINVRGTVNKWGSEEYGVVTTGCFQRQRLPKNPSPLPLILTLTLPLTLALTLTLNQTPITLASTLGQGISSTKMISPEDRNY